MATKDIVKSYVGRNRIAIVLLGIIIMGLGLHSHFTSAWLKSDTMYGEYLTLRDFLCRAIPDKPCPNLALERFYVSMVIITFTISLLGLVATFFMDLTNFKIIDMGYHAIAAPLLLVGATVYFVSAEQISNFFVLVDGLRLDIAELRRGEKLAAASLTVVHAVMYGVMAFLIGRQ